MIWFAWRQHRLEILVLVALVGALIGWMLAVGHAVPILVRTMPECLRPVSMSSSQVQAYDHLFPHCNAFVGEETTLRGQASLIHDLLLAAPLVVGLVLGTSLVAGDLQHRTNRLAWTQSVSRTRWFVVMSVLVVAGTAVLLGTLAAVTAWWTPSAQTDPSIVLSNQPRIYPGQFDLAGFVSVAYGVFALALGVALGAALRRVAWAALVAVPTFITSRILMQVLARPHFLSPLNKVGEVPWVGATGHAWYLGFGLRNLAGGHADPKQLQLFADECAGTAAQVGHPSNVPSTCMAQHHAAYVQYFQPLSRFWAFQTIESGIFVGAAAVLFALALWAVRRWRA